MKITASDFGYTKYIPIVDPDNNEPEDISEYTNCTLYLQKQGTTTITETACTIEEDNTIGFPVTAMLRGRYTAEIVLETIEEGVGEEEDEVILRKSYWTILHVKNNLGGL